MEGNILSRLTMKVGMCTVFKLVLHKCHAELCVLWYLRLRVTTYHAYVNSADLVLVLICLKHRDLMSFEYFMRACPIQNQITIY